MSSQGGLPPYNSGPPAFDGNYYSTGGDSPSHASRGSPAYTREFQSTPLGQSRGDGPIIYQSSGHPLSASASRTSFPGGLSAASRGMNQTWPQDYRPQYAGHTGTPTQVSDPRGQSSYPQHGSFGPIGSAPPPLSIPGYTEWDPAIRQSPDRLTLDAAPPSPSSSDYITEPSRRRASDKGGKPVVKYNSQRRPSNRDEFDGPHQLLDMPSPRTIASQERDLPHLPTNLDVQEQDEILCEVNDRLSECAFNFVAKYQFPIPLEADKRPVRIPADREWTEWVYLLKRLATKRRIPARVLYNGQIKQLVTVLENSLEMRHAAKHQSRPLKDDRNVLQLISAGIQVAKILKDAAAMEFLDHLYVRTERIIQERRNLRGFPRSMG